MNHNSQQAQAVAEVLELGEALFELALAEQPEQATDDTPANKEDEEQVKQEEDPREALRVAAHEFFVTLRLLLELEH